MTRKCCWLKYRLSSLICMFWYTPKPFKIRQPDGSLKKLPEAGKCDFAGKSNVTSSDTFEQWRNRFFCYSWPFGYLWFPCYQEVLRTSDPNTKHAHPGPFCGLLPAVPKLRRKLWRVSNFNQSINWHHHMKDRVEIGHFTKYDAFRVNRDQVMDLEIWFKVHTYVSNFETASPKTI